MIKNEKSLNNINEKIFLFFLLILFFTINYNFLDNSLKNFFDERDSSIVLRIIDGDTIETEIGIIRLLGINAPERNEEYFEESKKFLEEKIFNKTIKLEFGKEKYDKYKRILGYVFLEDENINLKLIENGLATPYFPSGKDKYSISFFKSWENCLLNNKNLCEKSVNVCKDCIEINEFDYKKEILILYNKCSFDCNLNNWVLKNEGRKNYFFKNFTLEKKEYVEIIVGEGEDEKNHLFWNDEKSVWGGKGDTIFIRDEKNNLVLWYNYP